MPARSVLLAVFFAVVATMPSAGQSVQVDAEVDAYTIGSEDRLTYSLRVQGAALEDINTPDPPATSNLVLVDATPATEQYGTSQNGQTERVVTFSWRYRPMRFGAATLEPVSVRIGGQTVTTSPIEVEVVPQSERTGPPPSGAPHARSDTAAPPDAESLISEDDLFIDVTPTETTAFVGEQVSVEYRLYFRPGIRLRQSRLAEAWEAPGFWREELEVEEPPRPDDPEAAYRYIVIKRVATFPTRTGSLQINPLRVQTEATPGLGMASSDQIMPMQRTFEDVLLSSGPVSVTAEPVPDDTAPPSFDGAVGTFRWHRSNIPDQVEVGEALMMSITVGGTGNLYAIEPPALDLSDHVDVFAPRVDTDFDRTASRLHGTRTFTYTIVPRAAEDITIPALTWSHFDPDTESFVTHETEDASVRVVPRTDDTGPPEASRETVSSADEAEPSSDWGAWGGLALLLGGGLGLGIVGVWAYQQWGAALVAGVRRSSDADTTSTDGTSDRAAASSPQTADNDRAATPAMRRAQMHLDTAHHALRTGASADFYRALERAVVGVVATRLNRSPNGLARRELFQVLEARGIDRPVRETTQELLRACDQARFSPSTPSHDSQLAALDAAHTLILHLDAALPSPSKEASI
ncbi:MAG: BatD family protein [Bacteroidota bacterium]